MRGCGNRTPIAVVGTLETLWSSHLQQWADESAARGSYPSLAKRRAVLNTHLKLAEMIEVGDVDRARHISARHLTDIQTDTLADRTALAHPCAVAAGAVPSAREPRAHASLSRAPRDTPGLIKQYWWHGATPY